MSSGVLCDQLVLSEVQLLFSLVLAPHWPEISAMSNTAKRRSLRNFAHLREATVLLSLLQPQPEVTGSQLCRHVPRAALSMYIHSLT